MSKLDEIEERVDLNYLINPGDLGMFSNTPSRKVAVADMRLLIQAVRQLGGILIGCDHSAGIGQVNDTTCPECIGMESLDPDVLELIANLEQGANEQG